MKTLYTRLKYRWKGMLGRCYTPSNKAYRWYGARGIGVCKEWHKFKNFYEFCMKHKETLHLELDRIDNDGDYSPSNCRFVTHSTNIRNSRVASPLASFGQTKCLLAWAEDPRCSCDYGTLVSRISRGKMGAEEAITTPPTAGPVLITAFGETKNLSEWADDSRCCVSAETISQRLLDGHPPDESITCPSRGINLHTAFGERKTLRNWATDHRCVVSPTALFQRVSANWDLEEAITTPGRKTTRRLLRAFGEEKSLSAWANDVRCVVSQPGLWKRIVKLGWDAEKAITTPGRW